MKEDKIKRKKSETTSKKSSDKINISRKTKYCKNKRNKIQRNIWVKVFLLEFLFSFLLRYLRLNISNRLAPNGLFLLSRHTRL